MNKISFKKTISFFLAGIDYLLNETYPNKSENKEDEYKSLLDQASLVEIWATLSSDL